MTLPKLPTTMHMELFLKKTNIKEHFKNKYLPKQIISQNMLLINILIVKNPSL